VAKPKSTVTEYRNYYLPQNFPALLISGDYWKISDVPSGRLHFHNCLEIGVCHSDSGFLEIYGVTKKFRAGDITVIPRNIPHTTYSAKGCESHWSWIFFDPGELLGSLLPSTWKKLDLSLSDFPMIHSIIHDDEFPQIHELVHSIIRELEEQKPSYQISAKGLFLSLFIELYRIQAIEGGERMSEAQEPTDIPDNSLVIAPALDYIEKNYNQQFSIDVLADLCHWSPTHFRRVFHDIMGTSPLDFINNTRIMKSCNFLRSTEESILDISEMVGFHSVSSFNRYFIKVMQMSPREYRKQMIQTDRRAENQSILEYAGWMFPEK